MKISELKNAPQWLLDADTLNADVELDEQRGYVVWRGGEWRGGEWRGGEWRGGEWYDGVWYDGEWRGGEWYDGVWYDGVWYDGAWRGGAWYDGVWYDGVWYDGEWRGGEWYDGVWYGEKLTDNLWTVFGLRYPVTISQTRMQIGCELHSFKEWAEFDDARICSMDRGSALKFWRAHKSALLALCGGRKVKEAA